MRGPFVLAFSLLLSAPAADGAVAPEEAFTPGLRFIALLSVGAGAWLGYRVLVRRRRPKGGATGADLR